MKTKRSATTAAPADPCCLVIFGASGDLARRLLVPALYNLDAGGLLPEGFAIIGVARADKSEEAFRTELEGGLRHFAIGKVDDEIARRLLNCVDYVGGDADVAFRQHGGGHTDGPNWPFFLDFATTHLH